MNRAPWTKAEIGILTRMYPDHTAREIGTLLGRLEYSIFYRAKRLGLKKSEAFYADPAKSGRTDGRRGAHTRFCKGHIPPNKGIKGWQAGGRSVETQFKKGHKTPHWSGHDFNVGDLKVEAKDGCVMMKIRDGYNPWRLFHVVMWEHWKRRPLPKGHCLRFRDGDKFNVDPENLELLTRAENMRRNSIYNLPPELVHTIKVLGALKRKINAKQNRRSAQSPV